MPITRCPSVYGVCAPTVTVTASLELGLMHTLLDFAYQIWRGALTVQRRLHCLLEQSYVQRSGYRRREWILHTAISHNKVLIVLNMSTVVESTLGCSLCWDLWYLCFLLCDCIPWNLHTYPRPVGSHFTRGDCLREVEWNVVNGWYIFHVHYCFLGQWGWLIVSERCLERCLMVL